MIHRSAIAALAVLVGGFSPGIFAYNAEPYEVSLPPIQEAAAQGAAADISGTWVAKMTSPGGEIEIVYRLKVEAGKITGTQSLPFGDAPIIDGQVSGDSFHFYRCTGIFRRYREA